MPSESPALRLHDMLHHIDMAARFAEGFDYERFRNDDKTVYAVTRCLEIISEASRRLPADMKARNPDIAWQDMAGAGSVYRHDYDDVTARRVSKTFTHYLQPLRRVVVEELRRLGQDP
jgi:uncharacterized protein with HEPN domain